MMFYCPFFARRAFLFKIFAQSIKRLGTAGLVVKADGSWPRGHGFKPRHCILVGCKLFDSYYIKEKIENKGSQMGHTKKKYFLKILEFTKWLLLEDWSIYLSLVLVIRNWHILYLHTS
jgi:hypothetical protein